MLVWVNIAGTSWRSIFLVNVPVCAAVIVAAVGYLPADQPRTTRRVDLAGVVTLSVSILLIVIPLTLGRAANWPPWTWVCLVVSVPAIAGFQRTQRRPSAERNPLINIAVMARRPIVQCLAALGIATGSYYALLFTLAQYVQHGLGRGALTSGLILLPWVAAFGLAGQITRRLPTRIKPLLPHIGYLLLTVAYLAIASLVFTGPPSNLALAALLAGGGLGLGTGFSTLITHLTDSVPPAYAPDISGISTTTLQIGGVLGVAVLGTFYLAHATETGSNAFGHAFALTNLALACTAVLAAALAYFATQADHDTQRAQT